MPASFAFPRAQTDLWMPAQSSRASASFLFSVQGVARLRDDATVASARAEITSLIADLARRAPNQTGIVSTALLLHEAVVGNIANALWILLAAVGLVLLVACANIANLFLVRSESRHREVAVRRALGAETRRLARYFLAESVLLGAVGGVLGLVLAWGGVRLLVAYGPVNLPRLSEVRIDAVVVIFTAALSLLAALAFGAIPLLRLAPMTATLHDSGRGQTATRGQHRARHVLMTAQVALALVLLVASGLMVRSVQQLRTIDLGFDPRSTLVFGLALPERAYETRARAAAAHRAILDRLNAVPGVISAAATSNLPLTGTAYGNGLIVETSWTIRINCGGSSRGSALSLADTRNRRHPPDTWPHDHRRATSIVVSHRRHRRGACSDVLPGTGSDRQASPFRSAAESKTARASVARDRRRRGQHAVGTLTAPPLPQLYMPLSIAGGPDIPAAALVGPDITRMIYAVRTTNDPAEFVAAARAAVEDVDPNLALAQVRTLQEMVDRAAIRCCSLWCCSASPPAWRCSSGDRHLRRRVVHRRAANGRDRRALALGAEPRGVAALILRQSLVVTMIGVGLVWPRHWRAAG
jgi:hypothetical protein